MPALTSMPLKFAIHLRSWTPEPLQDYEIDALETHGFHVEPQKSMTLWVKYMRENAELAEAVKAAVAGLSDKYGDEIDTSTRGDDITVLYRVEDLSLDNVRQLVRLNIAEAIEEFDNNRQPA